MGMGTKKRGCFMVEGIVGVKVVVKMASATGSVYWRSGEGKTLKEALTGVVTVGRNGGGKMRPECKEMVKGQLCWAELGLKERSIEKTADVKSSGAMDKEFLGEGASKRKRISKTKLVIKTRGKKK